jgi:antitoxin (DNA-binding transcriptional repressor) of toxin-antitoxin stability system
MKETQVAHLKENLSQYIQQVKNGEIILVKEKGKVVAQTAPPRPDLDNKLPVNSLRRLAQKGLILLPKISGKPTGRPKRIKVNGISCAQMIIENRR